MDACGYGCRARRAARRALFRRRGLWAVAATAPRWPPSTRPFRFRSARFVALNQVFSSHLHQLLASCVGGGIVFTWRLWCFFQVPPPLLRATGATATAATATAARLNEETAPNATGNDAGGAAAAVPPSINEARAFPLVINFITPDLSTRSNKGLTRVERFDSFVSPTPPSYAEKGSPLGEPSDLLVHHVHGMACRSLPSRTLLLG